MLLGALSESVCTSLRNRIMRLAGKQAVLTENTCSLPPRQLQQATNLWQTVEPLNYLDSSFGVSMQFSQLDRWLVSSIQIKQLTDIVFKLPSHRAHRQFGCSSVKFPIKMQALGHTLTTRENGAASLACADGPDCSCDICAARQMTGRPVVTTIDAVGYACQHS